MQDRTANDAAQGNPRDSVGVHGNAGGKATMTDTMTLDEYRELVTAVMRDSLTENSGARTFENFGLPHARVVLDTMLENAKSGIEVYSNNLNKAAFNMELIMAFLARSAEGQVKILVETPDVFKDPESALFSVKDLALGRIQVKYTTERAGHLAIIDHAHVRIETSHEDATANVAFGSRALAQEASVAFYKLWEAAIEAVPPT
jgi:hypothetical protein